MARSRCRGSGLADRRRHESWCAHRTETDYPLALELLDEPNCDAGRLGNRRMAHLLPAAITVRL